MNLDVVTPNVLSELSANRLVATDAASELASVANLANWIAGTTNQVTVTDDTDGTITLSGPQDLHTGANPAFAGETLAGNLLFTGNRTIYSASGNSLTIQTQGTAAGTLTIQTLGGVGGGGTINILSTASHSGSPINITAGSGDIGQGGAINIASGGNASIGGGGAGELSLISGTADYGDGADLNITGGGGFPNPDPETPTYGGDVIITGGTAGFTGNINLVIPVGTLGNGQIYCNGQTRIQSITGLLLGTAGVVSAITNNSANWNTAYTDRLKWDGGATDLVAATGRTSLGLGVADTPSFTGLISGVDAATNTAGTLKLWSAGANNYSTLFTAGTQTADATYTLPTAMPSSTSKFLQSTTGGVLSWETVAIAPDTLDAVLNAGDTSATHNLTLTAGTISAEQLTSTDDLTMQGKLLNTLATADTQALIIDGNTNKYTYASGNVTFGSLSRTVIGTGSVMPTSSYGWLRVLTWDYDFSGYASEFGSARLIGAGGDTLNYSGNIKIIAGGLASGYTNRFIANFSTLSFTGAFSNAGTKNFTGSWMGSYFTATTIAGSFVNGGSGTNTIIFCGGQFTTQRGGGSPLDASGSQPVAPSPSVTGTVNLIYCGGLFIGIGTTDGTSTSYGAYISGYGSDTNYDVYAPNAASTNYFAGPILGNTTITATGAFGCNGSAAQTAYASGGAAATTAGAFGFGSDAERAALTTLVANIRLALIANGVMS